MKIVYVEKQVTRDHYHSSRESNSDGWTSMGCLAVLFYVFMIAMAILGCIAGHH